MGPILARLGVASMRVAGDRHWRCGSASSKAMEPFALSAGCPRCSHCLKAAGVPADPTTAPTARRSLRQWWNRKTVGELIVLAFAWAFIVAVYIYCLAKVLSVLRFGFYSAFLLIFGVVHFHIWHYVKGLLPF